VTASAHDYLHGILLAIVQGITEMLPISSSGHLILLPRFMGWEDQGLAYDAALHVGTLVFQGRHTPDSRLAWAVVIGTIPVALVGLLFKDTIENAFRNPMLVAANLAVFGVLLWLADKFGPRRRGVDAVDLRDGLLIGMAQAMALVPGTSRSGITMTAGLAFGLTREAAARFSFLLSVPAVTAAGAGAVLELAEAPGGHPWGPMLVAMAVSAVTGFLTIHYLLRFIQRVGMAPFMWYRLVLAGVCVYVFA
jgi:undecaprenyl-diphosphatase